MSEQREKEKGFYNAGQDHCYTAVGDQSCCIMTLRDLGAEHQQVIFLFFQLDIIGPVFFVFFFCHAGGKLSFTSSPL